MHTPPISVVSVSYDQLKDLVPLFDAYRRFYGRPADLEGAYAFLHERISLGDSLVNLAYVGADPAGFSQVYRTFSSVHMRRNWILNDLYVEDRFRKRGIGTMLLDATAKRAKEVGIRSLSLETGADNHSAQKLYERFGFRRSERAHYSILTEEISTSVAQ